MCIKRFILTPRTGQSWLGGGGRVSVNEPLAVQSVIPCVFHSVVCCVSAYAHCLSLCSLLLYLLMPTVFHSVVCCVSAYAHCLSLCSLLLYIIVGDSLSVLLCRVFHRLQ